jgi:hypothetical protein
MDGIRGIWVSLFGSELFLPVFLISFIIICLLVRVIPALFSWTVGRRLWARTLALNSKAYLDPVKDLRSLIASEKNLVLFCGAGVSASAGFPCWSEMLKTWADEVGCRAEVERLIDQGDYEGAAEALGAGERKLWRQGKIYATFNREPGPQASRNLPDLLPLFPCDGVVTTNFDRVLEAAFEKSGRPFNQIGYPDDLGPVQDALDHPSHQPFLLKLHGDAASPEHWVLTKADYIRHYGAENGFLATAQLPRTLMRIVEARRVLFIGCSLNKDRFLEVLGHKRNTDKLWARHFALQGLDERLDAERATAYRKERELALDEFGVTPIWYPVIRDRKDNRPDHSALNVVVAKLLPRGSCRPEDERAYAALGIIVFAATLLALVANRTHELALYWVAILGIPFFISMLTTLLLPLALRHALEAPAEMR